MSKKESIMRCNLIIRKLRTGPATFNEITDFLRIESEIQSYNYLMSLRTFQRDLDDIRTIYNIDIKYDFSNKYYYISSFEQPQLTDRLLEAFDLFNSLKLSSQLSEFIHLNKRKALGTENMPDIINAIKKKVQINFQYTKYLVDEISYRTIEPYGLKEFSGRWYVLGLDLNDKIVKSFGLDRITEIKLSDRLYTCPQEITVNEYYKNCFGIEGPNNRKPCNVIIECNKKQAKFIKSLPIHSSQTIIAENNKTVTIKLFIIITYDLIMELLSYGNDIKVIKPKSLANKLIETYQKALEQYR